jgi:hypothetical protein
MQLHEMLKQELESIDKEWLQAKKALDDAEKREASLRGKKLAIKNAYEAVAPARVANAAQEKPFAEQANENGQRNTTEFIRDLIRTHPDDGISAVEIWHAIQKAKIEVARNYIYAVLARDEGKNRIAQRGHRYYPRAESGV